MTTVPRCPECGGTLMGGAQQGMCARCLLAAALRQPDVAALPAPGEWIGSYRVVRLLGEGGMGMVYLAAQEQPIARQVALKIIKLGMDTRAVLARFQSEGQALALMEHPNIAQVYEAGSSANGRPYFAMEYVPGIPITQYCDRHRLRTGQRLELFLQVAHAAQHAHQKGVIHRDLKPSNILVMERDGEAVPKIIDFGLARATERTFTEETLFTEAGVLIGTPEYMSPEQASPGGPDVDTRTDIYSLGVLLYELLVGTVPFDSKRLRSEGYEEIRRIIREDDPPTPSTRLVSLGTRAAEIATCRSTDAIALRKQVRGDLEWITMTAMAKDRNRRYASASELAADISRHIRDEPVMASPPSASYRLGKFIRKNRGPVLALLAVFVSLLLGLGASTVLYLRAERQRLEAQAQRAEAERQRAEADQQRAEATRQGARAEQQRSLAERSRMTAEQQRQEADQERREAELQHAEAEHQRGVAVAQTEEARKRSAEALRERSAAEQQRELAEQQSRAAAEQRAVAERQGTLAQRQSYAANLIAADLHIRSNEIAEAKRRLFLCPPGLRGWEWRYLLWKCDTSMPMGEASRIVFDPAPDKVLSTLAGHISEATCAAFNRNHTRAASGSKDGVIQVWDTASGQPLARLSGHKGPVWAVAFSADGQRIVSGGEDRMVQVWDASTGHEMYGIAGHGGPVLSVVFSPDRRTIVSGSADKTARIWDAPTGRPLHTLTGHECGVQTLAISPDGGTIATASCTALRLWDAGSGRLAATLAADWRSGITAVSFSPDGSRIAASAPGETRVWNALTYGGGILRRGGSDVDRTTISPGGLQLALHNAKTQTLEVWDTRQGKPAWTLRGSEAQVTALAFSPDSSRLATGSADKTLRIWNASTGQPLASGKLAAVITSLAFTADGARLLSGSADHALSVWSSVSIEHKSDLPMRLNITSSAYSPDAKRIAAGIEGTGDIQVWDAGAGRLLTTLKGHAAPVDALAFSPDGSRIVSGSRDKTIRVWDAATYDPLLVLGDHDEAIASLAFSPDGARIHSASPDGTVRIWETRQ